MKIERFGPILIGTTIALSIAGQVQAAESGATDSEVLLQLKRMIEQQQAQLDKQSAEITTLKERLGAGERVAEPPFRRKPLAGESQPMTAEVVDNADKLVTSRNANIDVELYGQINRAGLWADNGDSSSVYFVDNSASSSRIGVNTKGEIDDYQVGAKIELQLNSNRSSRVYTNEDGDEVTSGDGVAIRHVDGFFAKDGLGKFSFGRGNSASNGTSEIDLSGTKVAAYSGVHDMAGGQLYYDNPTRTLSDTHIRNTFSHMDGLSRRDRFRYDTPKFSGVMFSAGANEGDAYDFAGRYSRRFGSFKFAGALAWAIPGQLFGGDFNNQYNGSMSVLHDSGFNLTAAGGARDAKDSDRDDPTFYYGKLGYKAKIWDLGSSNFSIDYMKEDNLDQNDDVGRTYALAFVQDLKKWGTEVYLAYRNYDLERTDVDFDNVNALWAGARIKF